jgi:hypothetical protein
MKAQGRSGARGTGKNERKWGTVSLRGSVIFGGVWAQPGLGLHGLLAILEHSSPAYMNCVDVNLERCYGTAPAGALQRLAQLPACDALQVIDPCCGTY